VLFFTVLVIPEEYVSDWFTPYPGAPEAGTGDDLTTASSRYRVTRGGSFARWWDLTHTPRRHGPYPGHAYPPGLRIAYDPPAETMSPATRQAQPTSLHP
jgi:toxoflavin biosynthesis protein ToxD